MSPQEELIIRRILVAIDGSSHSLAALDAAADLAARLHAELAGLFVEDIDLLRLAGLPFAKELRYPTVTQHTVDPDGMERQLRAQATQARRALEEAAVRSKVGWTFRVVRGRVAPKVLEAAREADLLTLGFASRPITGRVRLGSTAREAAEKAPGAVLMLQTGSSIEHPVAVVFDGTEPSLRALAVAARLNPKVEVPLKVLILSDNPDRAGALREEAAEVIRRCEQKATYVPLNGFSARHVFAALAERGERVLVVGNSPLMRQDEIQKLVDELHCPILLVR